MFYREVLVSKSRKLEEEDRSLRNLPAANESFVRRLPQIKEESAEKERLRMTRELHDSLGYSISPLLSPSMTYLSPSAKRLWSSTISTRVFMSYSP